MPWFMKTRGDSTAPILAEYECPVHGRFELTVLRPAPDVMPCDFEIESCGNDICGQPAPWCFPLPRVTVKAGEVVQGKVMEYPPDAVCLDTRPLAEGMPYGEWKAKQDKITADINLKRHRQRQGRAGKVTVG